MSEPLSILLENAFQIAWEYLEGTGNLGDVSKASRFLSDTIEQMIRRGTRNKLILANKAINQYKIFNKGQNGFSSSTLELVIVDPGKG